MILRFAPSPTGYLHVGNCRTLLVNWLFARAHKAQFVLRIDDTDTQRSEQRFTDALLEDIQWLGLDYDTFVKQSDRMDRYTEVATLLKKSGRLYACYETPEELELMRKQQAAQGRPPLYNRAALTLSDEQKKNYEAAGRKPHWRFLMQDSPIHWTDLVRGELYFEGQHLNDPVLIREDGVPLYTLASVVDDLDMGITHIVRGEDHLSNTAVQMQIWDALGLKQPITFAHLSLLQGAEGQQLSKRLGTQSIRDFRAEGILPLALNSLLATIGTSHPTNLYPSMDRLIQDFDIQTFSKATPKFSKAELLQLNTKCIHQLSFEEAQKYTNFSHFTENFWLGVRENIESLKDIPGWWDICCGDIETHAAPEDKGFIKEALAHVPPGPWPENPWDKWIQILKNISGRKGKSLFMPLRQALTGQEHGPELKIVLGLMGPKIAKARLQKALSS